MYFDRDWEPGEHDSRGRRWARRIALVIVLALFIWGSSIVTMGGAG